MTIFAEIKDLPVPRGPFSHGVTADGRLLFVSGQGCFDPRERRFVRGTIGQQTKLTLACIDRVLAAAGTSRENVVSCRVYLQPLTKESFDEMNVSYLEFFGAHRPARTTIGAQLLNIDVEIDCIAMMR